jgi:hypothetical protein
MCALPKKERGRGLKRREKKKSKTLSHYLPHTLKKNLEPFFFSNRVTTYRVSLTVHLPPAIHN